jgi:hypothetical protein
VAALFLLDSNTCIRFLNGRSVPVERKLTGMTLADIQLLFDREGGTALWRCPL